MAKLTDLIGKTMSSVKIIKINDIDDEIIFISTEGKRYTLGHIQDCCESVSIDNIVGDLADLVGEPILMAEESTSDKNPEGVTKLDQDCFTWTFYKFATIKGYVDIRWYGESNGYYSESVDFEEK